MSKKELLDLNYTEQKIDRMYHLFPDLLAIPLEELKERIKNLLDYGYKMENIIDITSKAPTILGLTIKKMNDKLTDLEKLGYSKQRIITMSIRYKKFLTLSINDNIKPMLKDIEKIGFTQNNAILISYRAPSILGNSIDLIKDKIDALIDLGYSKEKVLQMIMNFPTLLTLSIDDNIAPKINFLNKINLNSVPLNNTSKLMQSIELTYARYMYCTEHGVEITDTHYRDLFSTSNEFDKKYKIKKEELLENYKYKESEFCKDARTI